MSYKHNFDQIDSDKSLAQSCPICETTLHRVVAKEKGEPLKTWIACECMAQEVVSDKGSYISIRERWGEEVLLMMRLHPELFPPEAIPKPIDNA